MTTKAKQEEKSEQKTKSPVEKECFIITPIGSVGSDIFNKTEGLIQSVLSPVLKEFGFIPVPAHYISKSGSINKQIIEKIVNCELVIANLTGVNPNVMYELAIRHSFGKSVITMAEKGTKLPFDISDQRTIFYDDSMKGVDEVKPALATAIEVALANDDLEQKISNPIYDALNQYAQIRNLPEDQQGSVQMILNKMDRFERIISSNRQQESIIAHPDSDKPYVVFYIHYREGLMENAKSELNSLLKHFSSELSVTSTPSLYKSGSTQEIVFVIKPMNSTAVPALITGFSGLNYIYGYRYEYTELPF